MIKKSIYIFSLVLFCVSIQAQVAVIANKSVPANQLKKSDLIDIYSGEVRYWSNGDPIYVFDLETEIEIRDEFYNLIGRSSTRMKSIWMKKLLLGEGDPPKEFSSQELLINKIASTKGAIGFVAVNKVTNEVKVIKILQ